MTPHVLQQILNSNVVFDMLAETGGASGELFKELSKKGRTPEEFLNQMKKISLGTKPLTTDDAAQTIQSFHPTQPTQSRRKPKARPTQQAAQKKQTPTPKQTPAPPAQQADTPKHTETGSAPAPSAQNSAVQSTNESAPAQQPAEPPAEQPNNEAQPDAQQQPQQPANAQQEQPQQRPRPQQRPQTKKQRKANQGQAIANKHNIDLTDSLTKDPKKSAKALGEELRERIKSGSFKAFFLALIFAILKDFSDIFQLGTFTNIFISAVLFKILFFQGVWFKQFLIKQFFGRIFIAFIAEFIPGFNIFPAYTIMVLLLYRKSKKEIKKYNDALEEIQHIEPSA